MWGFKRDSLQGELLRTLGQGYQEEKEVNPVMLTYAKKKGGWAGNRMRSGAYLAISTTGDIETAFLGLAIVLFWGLMLALFDYSDPISTLSFATGKQNGKSNSLNFLSFLCPFICPPFSQSNNLILLLFPFPQWKLWLKYVLYLL